MKVWIYEGDRYPTLFVEAQEDGTFDVPADLVKALDTAAAAFAQAEEAVEKHLIATGQKKGASLFT